MNAFARYDASVAFLRDLDDDCAGVFTHVGPCLHDTKATREPYEALVRAIGYQQLTAKAGDAIIARLKGKRSIPTPPPRRPRTSRSPSSTPCARAVSRRPRSPRSRPSRRAHCPA
jgi:3-methyladenine DNA glycosylase/8-oxoguanine DNA glycosylase